MTSHHTAMIMVGLALILALAHVLGRLARRCGQPAVIGEIVAGVLLGPTLFHGALSETLIPADTRPMLTTLGNLGVALFMFLVGLDLDYRLLRGNGRTTAGVAVGSIVCAFGLGVLLALYLWDDHAVEHRLAFLLFIGTAMSITAFPVLARILGDQGIQRTRIGALALASAAVGDVAAWLLFAALLTFTGSQNSWQVLLVVPYVLAMVWVLRPLLGRLLAAPSRGRRDPEDGAVQQGVGATQLALLTALLLVSGALCEWLGVHFIFGVFLAGAIVPRRGTETLRAAVRDRFETIIWMLLPAYFAVSGLRVDLTTVGGDGLGELGLILLVAIGGKFGGAWLGARFAGQSGRSATTLGILMNTRGLTELIILGVGLQLGLLDTELYSLMVVMALVTTAMTAPLLRWAYPSRMIDADLRELAEQRIGEPKCAELTRPVGVKRPEAG
ncbi:cation:proton antiporter [Streptomyces sp. NPDC007984]|uniref:cation:proton antiporter n=1 Tax=Streptomyces sp. NPDC007984 TaxID=3364801 RepID=UPI0036E17CBC